MDIVTGIVGIAALVLVYIFARRKSTSENVRPDQRHKTPADSSTKFHAVSIKFSPNACAAAREMDGRRFLSGAAPKIPLPECDALECKCRFIHHKDRRRHDERRNAYSKGFGGGSTGAFEREQREGRERRHEEPEDFFE